MAVNDNLQQDRIVDSGLQARNDGHVAITSRFLVCVHEKH